MTPQAVVTPNARTLSLTAFAMLAFAGNSLLCRVALAHTAIDPASFTSLRLASGALMLWLLLRSRPSTPAGDGNWLSAGALFVYAAGFSFAYVSLPAATGALLLFGAVQATMIGVGCWRGERLRPLQWSGLLLALVGLLGLSLQGLAVPSWSDAAPIGSMLAGSILMLAAGCAWGMYSLRGRGGGDPVRVTAGNFARTVPLTLLLSLVLLDSATLEWPGIACALASGAIASALGYVIWYHALPGLQAATAATVQLSVPVITALGGIALLGEMLSLRLLLAAIAILGGIAMVVLRAPVPAATTRR